MILVSRAYDLTDNYTTKVHVFSVVANDNGFQYVFGTYSNAVMFDSEKKVARVLAAVGDSAKDFKAADYLRVSRSALGHYIFSEGLAVKNEDLAIRQEQVSLDTIFVERQAQSAGAKAAAVGRRIQAVFEDFPELEDDLSNPDPNHKITATGMNELVLAAIGDIAPDGPNAWILEAIDDPTSDSAKRGGVIVINEADFDKKGNPLKPGDL
jgi:hypothetical protein